MNDFAAGTGAPEDLQIWCGPFLASLREREPEREF